MAITEGYQFGRVIEIEVRNFKTGEKIEIGNDLKIEFTFYKTIDESNEASVGQVKIYGLTEETRRSIGGSGGELYLRTGYVNDIVKLLFIASITNVVPEYSGSEIVTVINVSANFMDYAFSKTSIVDSGVTSIFQAAVGIAEDMNMTVGFHLVNVQEDDVEAVTEWIQTKKINHPQRGNIKAVLEKFCYNYGLTHHIVVNDDGTRTLMFTIPDNKVHIVSSWARLGYEKLSQVNEKNLLEAEEFNKIFVTSEDEANETAIVLNRDTGLIGNPRLEQKLVNAPEKWKLNANEEATQESLATVAQKKQKAAEKAEIAKQKALSKGKTPKAIKPKNYKIKIIRKYISVEALLNPSIKPQSHVKIESKIAEATGVYRVRTVKYNGNNRDGKHTMELNCEDSGGKYDKIATPEQINEFESNQTVSGNLNDDTNLGSDNTENVVSEE